MIELPFLSIGFCLLFVPLVRWISFRTGKVAQPRPDRWHRMPTPTLGGVGMFAGTALSLAVYAYWNNGLYDLNWTLIAAPAGMFVLGLVDDFLRLSPPVKLVAQLFFATLVIFFGNLIIHFFPWPILNILLTYFWLIGITNAINLLDNMDGISAGVAMIAAGFLAVFFWRTNALGLLALSLGLIGSILGFLIFNFPPARIFMGDSGSMFLGFTLAALAIARSMQASNVFAVLAVPVMIFLAPIMDTSLVTVTRLLRGQSPTQGGTDHTTHRLVAFGLSPRQVVLTLYLVSLTGGAAGMLLEASNYRVSLIVVPLVLIVLTLLTAYLGRVKIVTTRRPAAEGSRISRVVQFAYSRRLFELLLDLVLISFSYYVAYWTRYGLGMTTESMGFFLRSWPLALVLAYIGLFLLGVYRTVWGRFHLMDLGRYAAAAALAALATAAGLTLVDSSQSYPWGVFAFYALFLFLGTAGSRASFVLLDRAAGQTRLNARQQAVYFYGAGDAGELALRWLQSLPDAPFRPVGIFDDDARLWGRTFYNLEVLGGTDQLGSFLDQKRVVGIVITDLAGLPPEKAERLRLACAERGMWIKVLTIQLDSFPE